MTKQRLSRSESQEQTRRRIVEAAQGLFLAQGFRSTSLEQVAEAAGYTIGAVYSNFGNKLELGIAVVDGLYEDVARDAMQAIAPALGKGVDALFDAMWDRLSPQLGDPQWARLEMELAAFSNKDGQLHAAAARRYVGLRVLVRTLAELACKEAGRKPPADMDGVATALVGLLMGLALQRVSDPDIPLATFGSVMRRSMKALLFAPDNP